ncbi:ATP synthase subunit b,plastid [Trichinella pseudospiralis]
MWKTNLSTFDSWSFRWESTQELWFVLVEEDELPFLCLRSGFQDGLEDEMKILNIKVDGGLSSTVEGYYLCKQFQSMLVKSGFNVDESYETSVKCPENYKIDPYVNLDWRINTALGSIKKKYSGSKLQMVVAFVDKCLENVLKTATVGSWPAFKVHVPSVKISPFILEKFEE